MQIIEVDIDRLKEYENNPRHNEKAIEAVAESIKQFGFKVPVVIDSNYTIIAGHTRKKASELLGLLKVPCIIADDLTPEKIKAYRLADNKTAELAEWDLEKLEQEMAELTAFDIDMTAFGFDESLFDIEQQAEDDNFDEEQALEEITEPTTKEGDIWQLGRHRLICGDSTDASTIKTLMDGNKAEITFTSPPYNVGHNMANDNKDSKYMNYDDNNEHYLKLLIDFTNNAMDNSLYTFVNIQQLANNKTDLIDYLYHFKNKLADTIIWDKGHGTPNGYCERVLTSCFEYVFIFSEEAKRTIGTRTFKGNVDNIVRVPKQMNNEYSKIHNATFPIDFVSTFLNNFTNMKDKVLELFGGTGTTLIACEQLNRQCYMCELDPKYCDVIIKRWEDLTCEKAVLVKG